MLKYLRESITFAACDISTKMKHSNQEEKKRTEQRKFKYTSNVNTNTVASRYLDPAYLDPITYVEPMSESRIFLLYIYCISTSHVSNFF